MLEEQADVVAGLLQEFRKPVLDFDVVVRSGEAQAGRPFERPLADGVQLPDEPLEIESGHALVPSRLRRSRIVTSGGSGRRFLKFRIIPAHALLRNRPQAAASGRDRGLPKAHQIAQSISARTSIAASYSGS